MLRLFGQPEPPAGTVEDLEPDVIYAPDKDAADSIQASGADAGHDIVTPMDGSSPGNEDDVTQGPLKPIIQVAAVEADALPSSPDTAPRVVELSSPRILALAGLADLHTAEALHQFMALPDAEATAYLRPLYALKFEALHAMRLMQQQRQVRG
jgi:hypothetical protein